jgi:putative membrane protein
VAFLTGIVAIIPRGAEVKDLYESKEWTGMFFGLFGYNQKTGTMRMKALYFGLLACALTGITRFRLFDAPSAEARPNPVNFVAPCTGDVEFVKKAAEGGMLEAKLGEYMMSHTANEKVKMLAKMMYEDHTKANQELKELADKKSMDIPMDISKDKKDVFDNMAKMKGDELDKWYSDQMVKDHKEDIKLFEAESKDGKEADLKAWASGKLPTLKHHLEMSQSTCDALKKGTK